MTGCWREVLGSKVAGWGPQTPVRAVAAMGRRSIGKMDTADSALCLEWVWLVAGTMDTAD